MSGKRDKNKHTEGLPGLTALTVTLKTIKQKYMHTKSDAGSHLDSKRLKAYIYNIFIRNSSAAISTKREGKIQNNNNNKSDQAINLQ